MIQESEALLTALFQGAWLADRINYCQAHEAGRQLPHGSHLLQSSTPLKLGKRQAVSSVLSAGFLCPTGFSDQAFSKQTPPSLPHLVNITIFLSSVSGQHRNYSPHHILQTTTATTTKIHNQDNLKSSETQIISLPPSPWNRFLY